MKEGDIILTAIVQADGQRKNRPVLILRQMPKYGDFLVCGISTQLQQYIADFDEIIKSDDVDFFSQMGISRNIKAAGSNRFYWFDRSRTSSAITYQFIKLSDFTDRS